MKVRTALPIAAGVLAISVVFVAGFFYRAADEAPNPGTVEARGGGVGYLTQTAPTPMPQPLHSKRAADSDVRRSEVSSRGVAVPEPLPQYERNARMTIEVEDTVFAFAGLEERIVALGGEVVTVDLRGNDSGRHGTMAMEIPVINFSGFVSENRELGAVLDEHITARRLPKHRRVHAMRAEGAVPEAKDEIVALVTVTVRDEQISPQIERNRGVLAGSLSRSTGHFLKGMAVIVEGAGYLLPYALMLALLLGSIWGFRRVRRRGVARTTTGQQPETVTA